MIKLYKTYLHVGTLELPSHPKEVQRLAPDRTTLQIVRDVCPLSHFLDVTFH